ncbi:uncharacterized protein LOC107222423 isoform X2 [Neodiprion lecontei]|uniref:Uncharacterized protein LOC107222423 isoform X2 n=1 Tax=Neodiprion lecontei TaxID=441921 RepID=A0ABM3GGE7_NEOLC|nr:uncharacterized protein LOC107222423 isoform X2 [Neodiprion lecontei]
MRLLCQVRSSCEAWMDRVHVDHFSGQSLLLSHEYAMLNVATTRSAQRHASALQKISGCDNFCIQESNPADSPTNDEVLSSGLAVSSTKHSIFSGDPPSAFEMHARRMQIYLEKNTDHSSSEALRDKLIECYKNAKAELAKKLDEKRRMKQPRTVGEKPKMKPRTLQASVRTIRECNGIKTISYDNVPRELPAGVKCCDLSETTSDSNFFPAPRCERSSVTDKSLIPPGQGRGEDGISGHNRRFADLTFKDLNLSDTENTESGFGSA